MSVPKTARIAAVYCVYNEEEYLECSVRSVLGAVERVFLCLGSGPYTAYRQDTALDFPPDRTEEIAYRLARDFPEKIEILKRKWDSQLEHRDAVLPRLLELGMTHYFLVDGDEVYRRDHLERIRERIARKPRAGTFIVKCHTFWRSFRYRIPAQELSWRPRRIFKLTTHGRLFKLPIWPHRLRFKGINDLNSLGPVEEIAPEEAVFYHFSYARSPQRMREKLATFPHAREILNGWYEQVWLSWPENRQMKDIHPTDPPKFPQAILQSTDDLPEAMRAHPYYGLDIIS